MNEIVGAQKLLDRRGAAKVALDRERMAVVAAQALRGEGGELGVAARVFEVGVLIPRAVAEGEAGDLEEQVGAGLGPAVAEHAAGGRGEDGGGGRGVG